MEIKNIKFTAQAIFSDNTSKTRFFCTEQALSNWANKMWHKDHDVTVDVYKGFGSNIKYATYHE